MESLFDKSLDHFTYACGLIAQAIATGCSRYDNRFGVVQWVNAMLRFDQYLLSLYQVEHVKALLACIALEMIAELRAMDGEGIRFCRTQRVRRLKSMLSQARSI